MKLSHQPLPTTKHPEPPTIAARGLARGNWRCAFSTMDYNLFHA
jgi:hypothetical protein